MAIAFDATSNGGAAATTVTVSHAVGAGSNRVLITGVECQGGDLITGVTFNGTAMTLYLKFATGIAGFYNYIYTLVNPTNTTANIVATASSSATNIVLSCSYSGVDQTTPLEANNTTTTTSANPTVSVTTLTDNAWVVGTIRLNQFAVTASTNTTDRNNWVSDIGFRISDTNAAQTPTGSKSQNWTSASQLYAMTASSMKPFGAAAATPKQGTPKMLMGVGS